MPHITIRHFADCPNWQLADERLRAASAGRNDVTINYEPVETAEDAERLGFTGSPTILIDGVDPFAEPGLPAGLSCRLYPTSDGPSGSTTVDQLRQAISASRR